MSAHRTLQRRHLEALVAIAGHHSVHAAARSLGMAQPALSRLLSEAERLLGDVRLFERSTQGSRPTERGERLVAQARFVLGGMQRLAESAADRQPAVRVGCIARAMHTLMPLVLQRVRPEDGVGAPLQLQLAEGTSTELLAALARAELDFAIVRRVGTAEAGADLDMKLLYDERTAIVCAPGHRIGGAGAVPLSTLAKQEWVLPRPQTGSRMAFDAFWSRHGQAPIRPVVEVRSFETSLALVERTRFLAIAPEPIARRYEQLGLVRVLRLREVLPGTPVMLACARAAADDPVLRELRDLIRDAAREAHQQEKSGKRRA